MKTLAHHALVQAEASRGRGDSWKIQRGGHLSGLRDIKLDHVVEAGNAKEFLDFADGFNEFRQGPGKIESLHHRKTRHIPQAMPAVRVDQNAQWQTPLLQALELTA